ncbi:DUF3299 domain-containing protein [Hyphobacterium sp. CCMP332]|nr:DUF3299 domain-containing protein [Hyphobacterium sp. CCMP332]
MQVLNKVTILALILITTSLVAQDRSLWKILANVNYKTRYDEKLKYEVDYPVFGEESKTLEGKIVRVKGYMVPLEEYRGHNFFVLSALPYNVCFFCGAAGPETVMEVYTKEDIEFSEKPIWVKGRLKLNDNDYDHLMYILEDAVQIEP